MVRGERASPSAWKYLACWSFAVVPADLLSMTDLFSYLLPYPAVSLSCDSKLQSLTNLPSKLTVTALLVDSGKSSLVIKQREYQFNPTFS